VKKKILILIGLLILLALWLRVFSGDEDTWLCTKTSSGKLEWVKHGNPSYPKPVVFCDKHNLLPKTEKECLDQGGTWKKRGIEPFATCNMKAVDRGNLCKDGSECEGLCQVSLSQDELSQGMRGKLNKNVKYGQCSVWVVELGCQGIMKNGKAQVMCLD
jgi:hypothetical protein